jgi:hypothetical protein
MRTKKVGDNRRGKQDVIFTCYPYQYTEGLSTMFQFWVDGIWDEDKDTLEQGLKKYPADRWNWVLMQEEDDE